MADLNSRLTREGFLFNFFQAITLLEEHYRLRQNTPNPVETGRIRLSASPSLVFPPADIERVKQHKNTTEFILTFMGLVGVSSPLPYYFTEYIARHEENSEGLSHFLSIFNHRMYTLFYKAWQKYRFVSMDLGGKSAASNPLTKRIAAIAGISDTKLDDPFYLRVLSYAGSFAGKSRGKEALRTMVSDFFGEIPVAILEWQPRWTDITNPPKIGVDSQLGISAIAGTKKWDVSGKFRVAIGPLPRGTFETFLPGSDKILAAKQLVALFCCDPLDFDIEIKLESSDLVPVVLGQNMSRLGETSSLGKSDKRSDVSSIVIE